ncbi:MAG TPA: hypothetical protein VLW45_04325 [Pelomicrobium sp.]|nr:hypothetical protein [Pelomicrobium sp.]
MQSRALVVALLLAAAPAAAAPPWAFDEAIDVTTGHGPAIFHHLESAGRRGIAVSDGTVAVVWEDNRGGRPGCYVALKRAGDARFATEIRLSGDAPAFEPVIAPLGGGRFLAAWEEDGRPHLRLLTVAGAGKTVRIESEGGQITLAAADSAVAAAWARREGRFSRIVVAPVAVEGDDVRLQPPQPVDPAPPVDDQQYPTLTVGPGGAVNIAWEDRRHGHTRIVRSRAADGRTFSPLEQVNELSSMRNTQGLGRGMGAMRVSLARFGADGVVAVWADKRDFLSGYDVYAGLSTDGGGRFGRNEKVQDGFGNEIAQWHPAVTAHASGAIAVAWDDDRDGTPDIWLSWKIASGWSDDVAPPGASGAGAQVEPVLALDEAGDLHLAWIDKPGLNAPTRIRYLRGRR